MSEAEKDIKLMREGLDTTISDSLMFSDSQKSPHAGLYLQRGLCQWDKNDPNVKSGNRKSTKEKLIDNVSKISFSPLYTLAYERWKTITSDEQRFAVTAAKIVGRLYTGLSSATALETGLTTHHTYGMPMLAGSSVKGAVASYAAKIKLTPESDEYQILFGDEKRSGAMVWHDAWWIPDTTIPPFVGEIITTHHQKYYNHQQEQADEMESPIPNQQIACQGSFYFVIECGNKDWANFAKKLLLLTLENQGIGSKTASGYGYFTPNKAEHDSLNAQLAEEKKARQRAEEEKARQHAEAEKAKRLAAMPEHERLVAQWLEVLDGTQYTVGDAEGAKQYAEFKLALEHANANANFDVEQKKWIAEQLAFRSVLQNKQPKWLEGKREREIKNLLRQLSS